MRALSMLMVTGFAAMTLLTATACMEASGGKTIRSDKRSANACAVDKDDKPSSKTQKKSTAKDKSDDEKDAWSDSYGLQSGADLWTDVKTVLTNKCVACHAGFDTYGTAVSKIDVYIERMQRTAGAVGFMPQGGAKTDADLALLEEWKNAGTPQTGDGSEGDAEGSDDDDTDDDDGDDEEDDDSDDEDDEDEDDDSDDEDDDDDSNDEDC